MASPGRSPGRSPAPDAVAAQAPSLPGIFGKSAGMQGEPDANLVSPSRGPRVAAAVLQQGSNDHLGLAASHQASSREHVPADHPSRKWSIVSDFIASHGDRVVHFSGEAYEMLNSLPVKRYVVITDSALYRIAQTTVDTGIFFDCRLELDSLSQLIAQDVAASVSDGIRGGAEVQVFTKHATSTSVPRADSRQSNIHLAATLNFGSDVARRKAFLLAVCVVRPTLSILQKRSVVHVDPAHVSGGALGGSAATPSRSRAGASAGATSEKRTPRFLRLTESAAKKVKSDGKSSDGTTTKKPYSPARFRASEGTTESAADTARELLPHERPATSPSRGRFAAEMSDSDFVRAQQQLRESLEATTLDGTSSVAYDSNTASRRPTEESLDRTLERERIKAMVASREAQLVQNIEFKVKYPQKVPTRVPPGVEYDKAHEERRALPDDFSDSELLGPSLFPLWRQWKETGGLLGENGMPTDDWTLYDSNDLIDSLAGREDFLYGHIGQRSLRRLVEMREIVAREKMMFLNKQRMVMSLAEQQGQDDEEDEDEYESPYAAREPSAAGRSSARKSRKTPTVDHSNRGRMVTGKYTRVHPFRLSKGQSSEQRLKLMDTAHLLGDMKHNFEAHLKTLHALKKDQLQRELDRATGGHADDDEFAEEGAEE